DPAGRHVVARVVDDPDLVAGHHGATAVGAHVIDLVGYEDVTALRRPDAIQDVSTGARLPTRQNGTGQRLAGADADPHRSEVGVAPDLWIRCQDVGIARWHAVIDRRPEVADHVEHRGRGWRPSQKDGRRAYTERHVERVPQTVGEVELCNRESD